MLKRLAARWRSLASSDLLATAGGLVLLVFAFTDVFLTLLHPDRDSILSKWLNRGLWLALRSIAKKSRSSRREWLGLAGPIMVLATIVLWATLMVVGFALLAWPVMSRSFTLEPPLPPPSFVDALYWSGVTFTTLGYGDITPVGYVWRMLSVATAMAGFSLLSAAIYYLILVFNGLSQREIMALATRSETGGDWSGIRFVVETLEEEGHWALRERIETWAERVRTLHQRLHRFQPLAFYLRSRDPEQDPEPMLKAIAEGALMALVVSGAKGLRKLRPAARHLDDALRDFEVAAMEHHAGLSQRRLSDGAGPTREDEELVERLRQVARERLRLEFEPPDAQEERRLLESAACARTFLHEIERLTSWSELHPERPPLKLAP